MDDGEGEWGIRIEEVEEVEVGGGGEERRRSEERG